MGLASYAVDTETVFDYELEGGGVIYLKYINQVDMEMWCADQIPTLSDDPTEEEIDKRREMSKRSRKEYIARHGIHHWEDDIPYSKENAIQLMTDPDFASLATSLLFECLKGSNFQMERAEVAKKFAPGTSPGVSDGEQKTEIPTLTQQAS